MPAWQGSTRPRLDSADPGHTTLTSTHSSCFTNPDSGLRTPSSRGRPVDQPPIPICLNPCVLNLESCAVNLEMQLHATRYDCSHAGLPRGTCSQLTADIDHPSPDLPCRSATQAEPRSGVLGCRRQEPGEMAPDRGCVVIPTPFSQNILGAEPRGRALRPRARCPEICSVFLLKTSDDKSRSWRIGHVRGGQPAAQLVWARTGTQATRVM